MQTTLMYLWVPTATNIRFAYDLGVWTMQVEVQDEALVQTLEVNNTGRTPMRITTAMHTYFRVGDISQVAMPWTH